MSTTARRLLGALIAAIAAMLVVAGCSSSDDSSDSSAATREYTDINGTTVKVPENPERVVTLSEPSLDAALALGVTPVGTAAARGQEKAAAYLGDRAADIPIVASSGSPNLQQILAMKPDLIIVDDTTGAKNAVGELTKIAPTVVVGKFAGKWQDYFQAMSNLLGKSEQHQKVVDQIDTTVASTKDAVSKKATDGRQPSATVLRWGKDGPTIVGGNSLSSWVLNQVGMVRPASQQKIDSANKSGQKVSLENIDLIDADYVFFGALGGKDQAAKDLDAARKLPGFANLQAEKDGHIYPVDGVPWTSASGPLGIQSMLADIGQAVR